MRLSDLQQRMTQGFNLPAARVMLLACSGLLVLTLLILVYRGFSSYHTALAESKSEAERLVQILADHTELVFHSGDLTLRRAVEKQYFNMLFGNKLHEDMQNQYLLWARQSPHVSAMLTTDEKGEIQSIYRKQGYKTWLEGRDNLEREPYFRVHKNAQDSELLFVEPQPNWINQGRFILMSRRLSKLDGNFGGIVLVAISSSYLSDFFDSLKLSANTKMLLLVEHHKLLLGDLTDIQDTQFMQNALAPENRKLAETATQTAIEKGMFGYNSRILSYRHFPEFNMTLALLMPGEDIFKGWWRERRQDLLEFSLFLAFVSVLSWFSISMLRQIRRVERSEKTAVMANQAKSDFLANMSHELRTPLNAIIGFSEMLDSGYFGGLNAKQKERVHDIHMCGAHLLELINDILEFSKGAAGKLDLKEEPFNLYALAEECIRFFLERARVKKVEMVNAVSHELPRVLADQRKIKQMLINLLSNAVKFSHEGGKVELAARVLEDGKLLISVSDRGIGMASEDIPKALSVFGQVHKSDGYEGTGLGLPLCKVFAELHGGKLRLESLKGVGTRVSVVLPENRVLKTDRLF